MKIITFIIPCYNSAAYMVHCIESLLPAGEDAEIIIVNDGSKDDTAKIADMYAERYPGIVMAIHQENGGHGEGVNAGLKIAKGLYCKVVDSDDWLDAASLQKVLSELKNMQNRCTVPDMVICNYVYEYARDGTHNTVKYKNVFPQNRIFNWEEVGSLSAAQSLAMHALIFLTEILRESGLVLPKHTFYVDNIFAYQPLPYVKTLYFMDVDLYRYFIGRADQSVEESVLLQRLDQHVRVNKIMIDRHPLGGKVLNKRLVRCMTHQLSIMLLISSVYLQISGTDENLQKKADLWRYLKKHDKKLYVVLRYRIHGALSNLPGKAGRKLTRHLYHLAKKAYKFN